MARCEIRAEELTSEGFAAFGDVIERDPGAAVAINGGEVLRHHDLARVDVTADGGRPVISIFQVMKPATLPFRLRLMERHLLSSQAFMPLAGSTYLVAVAPPGPEPGTDTITLFRGARWRGNQSPSRSLAPSSHRPRCQRFPGDRQGHNLRRGLRDHVAFRQRHSGDLSDEGRLRLSLAESGGQPPWRRGASCQRRMVRPRRTHAAARPRRIPRRAIR